MKKFKILITLVVMLAFAEAIGLMYFAHKFQSSSKQLETVTREPGYEEIKMENKGLKDKYAELLEKYGVLERDRDNVLLQAKRLLEERRSNVGMEASLENLETEVRLLREDKNKLLSQNEGLSAKVEELGGIKAELEAERDGFKEAYENAKKASAIRDLEKKISSLEKENREALSGLQKKYNTLDKEFDRSQKEIERLKDDKYNAAIKIKELSESLKESKRDYTDMVKEKKSLEAKLKEIDRLNSEMKKKEARIDYLEENLTKYKKDYAQALKKNKALGSEIKRLPSKFSEIARQNEILKRQTSTMHYNLGVFYTKKKEYKQAVTEFMKTVEINPEDAYAHFNLGYIYAEYLVNRKMAIEHFRHFLRLAKSDDKDVDWVRKYLLTWETYEGKAVLK